MFCPNTDQTGLVLNREQSEVESAVLADNTTHVAQLEETVAGNQCVVDAMLSKTLRNWISFSHLEILGMNSCAVLVTHPSGLGRSVLARQRAGKVTGDKKCAGMC